MGRELKMLIEQINRHSDVAPWQFVGFFDDGLAKGEMVNGAPVLGNIHDLNNYPEPLAITMGIGYSHIRRQVIEKIANKKISFPTLIHPNAQIGSDAVSIGEGCVISAGCVITVNITMGNHVLLNWCCTVGHDAVLGDFVSLMPSVNISGGVNIGEETFVGTGANIINHLKIGSGVTLGAGSVVTTDIPPGCTAVGVPAKPIKFNP